MTIINAISAKIAPSTIKMNTCISVALILIGSLSLSGILPIANVDHNSMDWLLIGLCATIIGYTFIFAKAHFFSKIILSILTGITTLAIFGTIPQLSQTAAITVASIGGVGSIFNLSLILLRQINIKKIVNEMVEKAKQGPKIQDIYLVDSFQYAMLHYELATLTNTHKDNSNWLNILNNLNGNVHIHYPSGIKFLLDCSIEIDRYNNQTIQMNESHIEELTLEQFNQKDNCEQLCQAYQEAFDINTTNGANSITNADIIRHQLKRGKTRLFVGRHPQSKEILGGLLVTKIAESSFEISSLCRRAKATKINLTLAITNFLKKRYQAPNTIYCQVLLNNRAALDLYQKKMSFKITSTSDECHQLTLKLT